MPKLEQSLIESNKPGIYLKVSRQPVETYGGIYMWYFFPTFHWFLEWTHLKAEKCVKMVGKCMIKTKRRLIWLNSGHKKLAISFFACHCEWCIHRAYLQRSLWMEQEKQLPDWFALFRTKFHNHSRMGTNDCHLSSFISIFTPHSLTQMPWHDAQCWFTLLVMTVGTAVLCAFYHWIKVVWGVHFGSLQSLPRTVCIDQ